MHVDTRARQRLRRLNAGEVAAGRAMQTVAGSVAVLGAPFGPAVLAVLRLARGKGEPTGALAC
jgi:hypothetical protein